MKINTLTIVLSLACFSLSAQVDKTAATIEIAKGWAKDASELQGLKKFFSPNLKIVWPGGNVWPDGSDGSLEQFWPFYTSSGERYDTKMTNIALRELNNETYLFCTVESTVLKNEEHPGWVGTTSKYPGAYRMIWEGDQIKEWHVYFDSKSIEAQHEAGGKK
jgi:hypothetical protein